MRGFSDSEALSSSLSPFMNNYRFFIFTPIKYFFCILGYLTKSIKATIMSLKNLKKVRKKLSVRDLSLLIYLFIYIDFFHRFKPQLCILHYQDYMYNRQNNAIQLIIFCL